MADEYRDHHHEESEAEYASFDQIGDVMTETPEELIEDGWRQGKDGLWRNDRFGGSYKTENALQRIGSKRGEITCYPSAKAGGARLRGTSNWSPPDKERVATIMVHPEVRDRLVKLLFEEDMFGVGYSEFLKRAIDAAEAEADG